MKSIALASGNDGHKSYDIGDPIEGDSEWHRRMLINGLAEPQDDRARTIAGHPGHRARFSSPSLQAVAAERAASASGKPGGKKKS